MAHELNVPLVLKEAAQLIVSSRKCRSVDLAKMGDRVFMLRAYTGITADEAASRENKDKKISGSMERSTVRRHLQPALSPTRLKLWFLNKPGLTLF